MSIAISFGPVPPVPPLRSPLPAGSYHAQIISARAGHSQARGPVVDLVVRLTDPPYAGRQLSAVFSLDPTSLWEFQGLLGTLFPDCSFEGEGSLPLERLASERVEVAVSAPAGGSGHVTGVTAVRSGRPGPRAWRRRSARERRVWVAGGMLLALVLAWLLWQASELVLDVLMLAGIVLALRTYRRYARPRSALGWAAMLAADLAEGLGQALYWLCRQVRW